MTGCTYAIEWDPPKACRVAGRVASVLPVPPVGPPPGYFARPSRELSSSRTKDTDSRSQFSVASLAAPLLPASAASLANRSAMEQASLHYKHICTTRLPASLSADAVCAGLHSGKRGTAQCPDWHRGSFPGAPADLNVPRQAIIPPRRKTTEHLRLFSARVSSWDE